MQRSTRFSRKGSNIIYMHDKLGRKCSVCGKERYPHLTRFVYTGDGEQLSIDKLVKLTREELDERLLDYTLVCHYCKRDNKINVDSSKKV